MRAQFSNRWRYAPLGARCLLAVVFASLSLSAQASCFANSDPRMIEFEKLLRADPAAAQVQLTQRLADAPAVDSPHRASLYAALAESWSILEKHEEQHEAVDKGLALVEDVRSATYLNLLFLDAARTLDEREVAAGLARAEVAVKAQVKDTAYEACALTTLGLLEYLADRGDLASMHLTRAYRMSGAPEHKQTRMLAAGVLSVVLQTLRDFNGALALSREVIDWNIERKSIIELSSSHFIQGFILIELGDAHAARAALERSRALSLQLQDGPVNAYTDLLLCTVDIDLKNLRDARHSCESALRSFDASQTEPRKQTLTALAEIDLLENDPTQALAKLDQVLDLEGRDLPPFRLAHIYELRGRTHRALGHDRAALEDYERFMARFKANKEDERVREATAIRVRFETDREIERNQFLQRELQSKNERLSAQSERLRWMIVAAAACVGGMILLTCLLLTNRKKKRLLARLAREDELTGLPNRRYTLECARKAWDAIRADGAPLTIGILDLDHFKRINDRLGHAAGDFVLKEFARLSRDNLRETDILGRWGGEEFLLVLPNTPLDEALAVVERIRLGATTIRGGALAESLQVTTSAGLATQQTEAATLEEIIARADAALYVAKNRGRNLVQVAQQSYDAASSSVRRTLKAAGIDLATGKFSIAS